MSKQCQINIRKYQLKAYSSEVALEYVNAVRYGYEERSKVLFNKLVFIKGIIRVFEDFNISDGKVFVKGGILNRFCKKVLLSKNNSLYLKSKNQKIILSEEDLNCLSCEDLCKLSDKVLSNCSTC